MNKPMTINKKRKVKFCPKHWLTNTFWATSLMQLWSIWEYRDC